MAQKQNIKWAVGTLVGGLLICLAVVATSVGREAGSQPPLPLVYDSADPLYATYNALELQLDQYGLANGRYTKLNGLREAGYEFFPLRNPYTRARLDESCDAPMAGAVCIMLDGAYKVANILIYDQEGRAHARETQSGYWNEIPAEKQGRRGIAGPYRAGVSRGYDDLRLRLTALGTLVAINIGIPLSSGRTREEAVRARLSRDPYNRIQDPVTGRTFGFSDDGYGERVKILGGRKSNRARVRVVLGSEIVYDAEVVPRTEIGLRDGYTLMRFAPRETPGEPALDPK